MEKSFYIIVMIVSVFIILFCTIEAKAYNNFGFSPVLAGKIQTDSHMYFPVVEEIEPLKEGDVV